MGFLDKLGKGAKRFLNDVYKDFGAPSPSSHTPVMWRCKDCGAEWFYADDKRGHMETKEKINGKSCTCPGGVHHLRKVR